MTAPLHDGAATLQELTTLPDATPNDMSQSQLTQVRDYLTGDLFAFAWFIFEYRDLIPTLHGRIAKLIGLWGTPGYTRLMVQIPREFFKTSLCTRANSLWQITRDPDAPVAIFNERLENAAKWLRAIRDTVASSELFQVLWPELLPPGVARNDDRPMPRWWKWSDTELLFQRGKIVPEASITALGMGAASAGGHWPKLIKDDLISEDAARSPTVMAAAIEWFDKSLYLERPALKGQDLIACTPWAYNDLYAYILRTYNYKLYRRAALEGGESIFPQKLTTAELLAQQARDPIGFSSQMLCRPRPGKDVAFEPEWLRYGEVTLDDTLGDTFTIHPKHYDPSLTDCDAPDQPPRVVPLHIMDKCLLFDPAPSEATDRNRERHARNAAVLEGIDPWGRRYVLEAWADRIDPYDVISQLFTMLQRWGANKLAIEEVNFSKVYKHWITREASRRGLTVRIIQLRPGRRDKDTRITAKIPDMRRGIYYWNTVGTEALRQEYVEYPYSETRDLLDAWAYDRDPGVLTRDFTPAELFSTRTRNSEQPAPYSVGYF